MGANYQLARSNNFSDSAFALPANNYDLAAEWGPSLQDVRHRFFGMVNFGVPMGMRLGVFTQGQSASPYNVITGFDTNRDTVVSDRPDGVGRNSARGSATWNLNARLSKSFGFGPQRQTDGRRAAGAARAAAAAPAARWRRRRPDDDDDGRQQRALPAGVLPAGVQHPEPHEPDGLHRQHAHRRTSVRPRRPARRGGSSWG